MVDSNRSKPDKDDRQARLAQALRENLRKRKEQERGRTRESDPAPDNDGRSG